MKFYKRMMMKNAFGTPEIPSKKPQSALLKNKKSKPVEVINRQELISVAAYYRAENRDFSEGDELADWLICEMEVDALLNKCKHL